MSEVRDWLRRTFRRIPQPVWRGLLLGFVALNIAGLLVLGIARAAGPHAPTRPVARATATLAPTATPTATPIPFARPELQAGVVFPRWGAHVYGAQDTDWSTGILALRQQTGARWVEMVVDLYQDGYTSTAPYAGPGTPTPADLAAGIRTARAAGLRVFVVPFLTVLNVSDGWGSNVHFDDPIQARAWFDGYWRAFSPYVAAAAQAGAAQIAIGHEYGGLESAPADDWQTLIARVRQVFPGAVTYDTNWSNIAAPRAWMLDPGLAYIGLSEYAPLADHPMTLSVQQLLGVWRTSLLPQIDALSARVGKPVILAEIGYRNTSDALYQPWVHQTDAPPDPRLQADAYEAATRAVFGDPHIEGIYFYAWSNGQFAPDGLPAAAILRTLYDSPAA